MGQQAIETSAIRRTVTVGTPPEKAFRVFTEGIGTWWPLSRYSVGLERAEGVAFEGDRIVERIAGGEEAVWGEVLAFEPPTRLLLTWHPGAEPGPESTEIEVRFTPEGGGTRVELEHRGWERLGERAVEVRRQYDAGWQAVLSLYTEAAG